MTMPLTNASKPPYSRILEQADDLAQSITQLQHTSQTLRSIVDQASQWAPTIPSGIFSKIANFYRTPEPLFAAPTPPEYLRTPWPDLLTNAVDHPSDDNCFNAIAAIGAEFQAHPDFNQRRSNAAIFFAALNHLIELHQRHPEPRRSVNFAAALSRVPFAHFVPTATYAPMMGAAALYGIASINSPGCRLHPHASAPTIDSAGRPTADTHNRALLHTANALAQIAKSSHGSDLDKNSYQSIRLENHHTAHSAQLDDDYLEYCDEHALPYLYPQSLLYQHTLSDDSAVQLQLAASHLTRKYQPQSDPFQLAHNPSFPFQHHCRAIYGVIPPLLNPSRHNSDTVSARNIKELLAVLPNQDLVYAPPDQLDFPHILEKFRIIVTAAAANAVTAAASINDRTSRRLLTIAAAGYAVHVNRKYRRLLEQYPCDGPLVKYRLHCIEDALLLTTALPDWVFPNTSRAALMDKDRHRAQRLNSA